MTTYMTGGRRSRPSSEIKWGSKDGGRLPLRDHIREGWHLPAIGPVAQDADLILRRYGACNGLDEIGAFSMVEHKSCFDKTCDCEKAAIPSCRPCRPVILDHAQRSTFGLMDAMWRSSLYSERYWGWWVLTTEHRDPRKSRWLFLNEVAITFDDWCSFVDLGRSLTVAPLDFGIRL